MHSGGRGDVSVTISVNSSVAKWLTAKGTYRRVGHATAHGVRGPIRGGVAPREATARGANGWMQRLPVHHLIGRVHLFLQLHLHVFERKLEGGEMVIALGHGTTNTTCHIAYTRSRLPRAPEQSGAPTRGPSRILFRTCCLLPKTRSCSHGRYWPWRCLLLTAEGGRSPP